MQKFKTTLETPDTVAEFIRCIQEVGAVVRISDTHTTVTFDVEDEYTLANLVRDLEDGIRDLGFFMADIPRPTKVTDDS